MGKIFLPYEMALRSDENLTAVGRKNKKLLLEKLKTRRGRFLLLFRVFILEYDMKYLKLLGPNCNWLSPKSQ